MSYSDKVFICRDCRAKFTFTAGEQEFFASRGFTNEPVRCSSCRANRKAGRRDYRDERSYGDYQRSERQMHPAVCADCGAQTQVPFMPRGDKPVYCSSCYNRVRTSTYR